MSLQAQVLFLPQFVLPCFPFAFSVVIVVSVMDSEVNSRLHALAVERAEVAKELKRLRSQAAHAQSRDDLCGFTVFQSRVAMAVFLQALDETPALTYLAQSSKRSSQPLPSERELADVLFTWVLQEDLSAFLALADSEDSEGTRVWTAARNFMAQWETLSWVRAANAKGVAPSATSLAAAYLARSSANAVEATKRSQRRWAQRFRKRWCLARRLPPTKPPLSDEELLAKARSSNFVL